MAHCSWTIENENTHSRIPNRANIVYKHTKHLVDKRKFVVCTSKSSWKWVPGTPYPLIYFKKYPLFLKFYWEISPKFTQIHKALLQHIPTIFTKVSRIPNYLANIPISIKTLPRPHQSPMIITHSRRNKS